MKTLAAIACTAALFMGLLAVRLQPEIVHEKKPFRYVPSTQVTGTPKAPVRIDKTTLIIQQDVNCWIGVPGMTCGSERTYL